MRDASEVIAELLREADELSSSMAGIPAGPTRYSMESEIVTLRRVAKKLATLPASTPPGDACVRHACKRVRMEMQAEIERLRSILARPAHAHLEGAHLTAPHPDCLLCDAIKERAELLAIAEGAEADRADARRWRFLRDDVNLSHVFDEIPNGDGFAFKQGADLDAAIDAARAGAVTQGEGS